jgi:DNA ligase-1
MKKIAFIFLCLLYSNLLSIELQKAKTFNSTHHIQNWLMSEKLDGIRAYWDGKEFKTRQGNRINAPQWFTKNFPPFELDGELWTKRMDFENIQSTVLGEYKKEKWEKLTYNIFEVPHAQGDFIQRLKKAQQWFLENKNTYVRIIPQKICKNNHDVEAYLKEITENNGEGIMLKNPDVLYESGISNALLKVKKFDDMEGEVIDIFYTNNQLKSLQIKLSNGIVFNLGNGFTQEERNNPPSIGSIVTFKYYDFTKNGKPKFASFMHVRKD